MSQNDGDMLRVKELLSMTGASKGLTVDEAAAEIEANPSTQFPKRCSTQQSPRSRKRGG